jgi:hypothetical protein
MAPPTEHDELLAAWRALAGASDTEGWRTIPVGLGGPCRLLAGRHFPGNEEALLVAFHSEWVPPANQLPQGHGFHVSRAQVNENDTADSWIALCRHAAGSLELFAMMAVDIVGTLATISPGDARIVPTFLGRIRAWQEFMRSGAGGVLGPESEIGLFGELEFMRMLIEAGVPAAVAVDAWRGPLGGVHDFSFGNGAIEVKTTAAQSTFTARIGSLEQLDDSLVRPLFLAGMRLAFDPHGRTLPALVSEVRRLLVGEATVLARLDNCLLHAGYLDLMGGNYTRAFTPTDNKLFPVTDQFPRLTRENVPLAVRSACYDVDLDLASLGTVTHTSALNQLGAR